MLRACATVLLLCSASLWGGTSVQIRVAHANAPLDGVPLCFMLRRFSWSNRGRRARYLRRSTT